jgi:hypothetical protein
LGCEPFRAQAQRAARHPGDPRSASALSFPAHVRTWYNAHDPRDVIALYPLNNDNFPVSLAVDNYQGVRNQTDEI